MTEFLSCLHGSEQATRGRLMPATFLSCLHGSEQQGCKSIIYGVISKLPARQ